MREYTPRGPKKVIQINEKELQQHLSTLVTEYSTGSSESGSRRGSGRDGRGGSIRTKRRSPGLSFRELHQEAPNQGRRS